MAKFKSPKRKAAIKASVIAWKKKNPDRVRAMGRLHFQRLRNRAMAALGSCCACCGEDAFEFLTIDHKNGTGAEHRRRLGIKNGNGGSRVYKDILNTTNPRDSYQILCWNCNCAIGSRGYCPHQVMQVVACVGC